MSVIMLPTWGLEDIVFNTVEDDGTEWIVHEDEGWDNASGPRLAMVEKTVGHGAYDSRSYMEPRTIVLTGCINAPDRAASDRALRRLAALGSKGDKTTLTVTEPDGVLTSSVRLAKRTETRRLSTTAVEFQLSLIAPDPVKHGAERSASTSLPLPGTGLDWQTGGGLDWQTGGGLDWGTPASNGAMVLTNAGTVETWPRHRIDGPLVQGDPDLINPMISLSSGQRLVYTGTLSHGDWLIIDTHPSRRSVLLNGSGRRRHLLTTAQWAPLPPGDVTLAFSADSQSPSARLTTYWSPAVA